jgi:crotonobetainyl-CoA:carnitine CoA-transferase CaiB-like acyl-CoA transferase
VGGVLQGVRVLEFGHQVAAPLVGVLLADQGAEVVRVDPPGVADGEREAFLHRGKQRITLDLKSGGDAAIARRLADRADVLLENFRPGVLDRLGLGWDALGATNPGLVYCSIPGFPEGDPRAGVPAWEGVVAAATANTRLRFPPEGWDTERPTYTALPLASNFAAFLASFAVVAALTDRHRTGRGERISVPLFNATFEMIGGAGVYVAEQGLKSKGKLDSNGSGTYRCADGRWVQFDPIGGSTRFIGWFLDAVGEPALAVRARLEPADPELKKELRATLTDLFASKPAAYWDEVGNASGAQLSMIRTSAEWAATEHARASEAVLRLDDPDLGPTWMAGRTIHTSAPRREIGPRHRPDADRAAILAALEAPAPAPRSTSDDGALPYEGLKVVDLCQVLAGPSGSRLLVEFGADVIKVNAPQRNIDSHGYVNRGKKSILLDIQSPAGQDVLWRLIEDADVLTLNFPAGTAENYGLGWEHVRSRNPRIVYVHVTCYGHDGSWAGRRGYETQGQATTGMMERHGRDEYGPGVHGPYNILDYGTGMVTGLAAALGIHHRTVTGSGVRVTTSLAQVGTLHQATLTVRSEQAQQAEPAGRYALGDGPLQHFYRASDGWFFLGAKDSDRAALTAVTGVAEPGEQTLQAAFATRTAAEWVDALTAAGLGASAIASLAELMADPAIRAEGLSVTQVSEEAGEVVMPGTAIRLRSREIRPGPPTRQPGNDARTVLAGVGLDDKLDELAAAWAVQVSALPAGWPVR